MSNLRLNALILDDEPHARKLLEIQIRKHCPYVAEIYSSKSASEARAILAEHQDIDILFLDIEMPEEDGISFLDSLELRDVYPVFVTSHAEYAIDAIKLHAFDYLLKPVNKNDLIVCLHKVISNKNAASVSTPSNTQGHLYLEVKLSKSTKYIKQSEIIMMTASGSYTEVHTLEETLLVSKNLKTVGQALDPVLFYRIHNSSIVNLKEIKEFKNEGNYVLLSGQKRVICSPKRKTELIERIKKA